MPVPCSVGIDILFPTYLVPELTRSVLTCVKMFFVKDLEL